jgi:hypothetical protein
VQPGAVEAEPIVSREEAVGLLFGVADILEELRLIRKTLGGGDEEEEAD